MSEAPKDGGPAFPPHHNPANHPSGMTLRDYFAGQALIAAAQYDVLDPHHGRQRAIYAYSLADAMLAVRGESHE